MNEVWNAAVEYAAILFGLVVGTIAHFGRKLAEQEPITLAQATGFLMQLGVIGLVAAVATRKLGVTDADMRALSTAVLAISTQEVIQYLKRQGWKVVVKGPKDDG